MKIITPFLARFALTATILTIVFRYFLRDGITHQSTMAIILAPVLYFAMMFGSGWYFGKRDGEYLPILDIGFRFHLTTYMIHNLVSILWIEMGFGSRYEDIHVTLMVAMFWGAFLLIHLLWYLRMRKNSINDLDKEDLFE